MDERELPPLEEIFGHLNKSQYEAVTADIKTPLQVIAGPGTGKTALLICRVAYLLVYKQIDPQDIIVTTFTKKATKEIKNRLNNILKRFPFINAQGILVGTFHSIFIKLLHRNHKVVSLPSTFQIADSAASARFIKNAIDSRKVGTKKDGSASDKDIRAYSNFISKCKSSAMFPQEIPDLDVTKIPVSRREEALQTFNIRKAIYQDYQEELKLSQKIDFDDCLLYAKRLLDRFPRAVSNIKHIIVDEFQDTNMIQLELLFMITNSASQYKNAITIVGDPDQSIYGFRNADPSNFEKFSKHFFDLNVDLRVIRLTDNYRSTKSILNFSEDTMRRCQKLPRTSKELAAQTNSDRSVELTRYDCISEEANDIAAKVLSYISRTLDSKYSDVAVLLRTNRASRSVQDAFIKSKIPYTVINGTAFLELKEIQIILGYLNLIFAGTDWSSFERICHIPGLGAAKMDELKRAYKQRIENNTPEQAEIYNFLEDIVSKRLHIKGIAGTKLEKLKELLDTILEYRGMLVGDCTKDKTPSVCLHQLFQKLIQSEEILQTCIDQKMKKDSDLEELKSKIKANYRELRSQFHSFIGIEMEDDNKDEGNYIEISDNESSMAETPLEMLEEYLQSVALFENMSKPKEGGSPADAVTISTVHAAKGLEWPVVFIPLLTDGNFPITMGLEEENSLGKMILRPVEGSGQKSNWEDEELRAFYVALTRAKYELNLSWSLRRYKNDNSSSFSYNELAPSRFLDNIPKGLVEKIGYGYKDVVVSRPRLLESSRPKSDIESVGRGLQQVAKFGGFQAASSHASILNYSPQVSVKTERRSSGIKYPPGKLKRTLVKQEVSETIQKKSKNIM